MSAVYGLAGERTILVLGNSDEGSAEEIFRRIRAVLRGETPKPFAIPPARFLYSLLKEHGADYFTANVDRELREHGDVLEDDMVLLSVGEALLKEKAADLAIALYRYYTASFPRIVVAWNDLGDAYAMAGQKEETRRCFERALELRRANARAKASLERL